MKIKHGQQTAETGWKSSPFLSGSSECSIKIMAVTLFPGV
jgi:hypothetical protein